MNNQIVESKRTPSSGFEMRPSSLVEAMEWAKIMADSDIVPKQYKGKPGNILVAIQMGHEIGLSPIQSLISIDVINGKPTIFGDAAIALVMNSPYCDNIVEKIVQDPNGNHRAFCTVKRKGHDPHTCEFSVEDAKKAGLWSKAGNWQTYPKRMLRYRALGFALRDKFSDVLKGLSIREEVLDYEVNNNASITKTQASFKSKSDMLAAQLGEPSFSEAEIIEEVSTEMDYSSVNKVSFKKIDLEQLNDLIKMINNDEDMQNYIFQKYEVDALTTLNEEQYILIRDELRLLNVASAQENGQESKVA